MLRKTENEELHNLYFSLNVTRMIKSRSMRWVGYETCMGEMRIVHKILVGKPQEKKPLGKPRHRWGNNNNKIEKV
jgi:hypothetical protein